MMLLYNIIVRKQNTSCSQNEGAFVIPFVTTSVVVMVLLYLANASLSRENLAFARYRKVFYELHKKERKK